MRGVCTKCGWTGEPTRIRNANVCGGCKDYEVLLLPDAPRDDRPMERRIVDYVIERPGVDSEQVALALGLPFATTDDALARLCEQGDLRPVDGAS